MRTKKCQTTSHTCPTQEVDAEEGDSVMGGGKAEPSTQDTVGRCASRMVKIPHYYHKHWSGDYQTCHGVCGSACCVSTVAEKAAREGPGTRLVLSTHCAFSY